MAFRLKSAKQYLTYAALVGVMLLVCAAVSCGNSEKDGKQSVSGTDTTVSSVEPVDVSISDLHMELGYGITKRIDAVGGTALKWSTSDDSIASVDSEGNIKGVDLGECVITATNEFGRSAQCAVTVKKTCYITIDDGPKDSVNYLLDALKETDVKATFFLVDTAYFSSVKRMYDEGHVLGLHTKRYHSYKSYYSNLELLNDHLEELTGIRSDLVRFPGGSNNTLADPLTIRRVANGAHDLGYRVFDWTISTADASPNRSFELSCLRLRTECVGKQEIILFHDQRFTPRVIRTMVPELRERGYVFETLDHYPDDSYEFKCRYNWNNKDVPSDAVELNKTEAELETGGFYKLKASMTPGSSSDYIAWQSSDKSVVKVNQDGQLTGIAPGEAVITVKTTSGATAQCKVKVLPAP